MSSTDLGPGLDSTPPIRSSWPWHSAHSSTSIRPRVAAFQDMEHNTTGGVSLVCVSGGWSKSFGLWVSTERLHFPAAKVPIRTRCCSIVIPILVVVTHAVSVWLALGSFTHKCKQSEWYYKSFQGSVRISWELYWHQLERICTGIICFLIQTFKSWYCGNT